MNVDDHYPYAAKYDSPVTRAQAGFPDMLRGIADRTVAQFAFDGWLATSPGAAKFEAQKVARNPQHWNGT